MRRDRASSSSAIPSTAWVTVSFAALMRFLPEGCEDWQRRTGRSLARVSKRVTRSGRLDAEEEEERPIRRVGRAGGPRAAGVARVQAPHRGAAATGGRAAHRRAGGDEDEGKSEDRGRQEAPHGASAYHSEFSVGGRSGRDAFGAAEADRQLDDEERAAPGRGLRPEPAPLLLADH